MEIIFIFGPAEEHLELFMENLPVKIGLRGNILSLEGQKNEVEAAQKAISAVRILVHDGVRLEAAEIIQILRSTSGNFLSCAMPDTTYFSGMQPQLITKRGKPIRAKTIGQRRYVEAIDNHSITFGLGPAGTGKTYLAVATAVKALETKAFRRIILCRPAVEAGENLGFLPGNLHEKIDPYLRPLFDALTEMLDADTVEKLLAHKVIEIAPLAYMRGRTLNESFIILDEAQNTTPEQMKMFLTRLGIASKMVITGDITQIDRKGNQSGVIDARKIVENIDDIAFVDLTSEDVVRNPLVSLIVDAYEAG